MKKLKPYILGLTITFSAIAFITFQLSVYTVDTSLRDWKNDFDGYIKTTSMQMASTKPVAIFFYTDWCVNCKKLREEILAAPMVKEFVSENFLAVKINPENGKLENQLSKEFGVIGYPSFFVSTNDGKNTIRIKKTSNISPEEFINQLKFAIKS